MVGLKIGVVALQGDVSEHVKAAEAVAGDGNVLMVRKSGIIPRCGGIVLPGGESTTIGRLMEKSGISDEIKAATSSGVPLMATCAGLVLVSNQVDAGDVRKLDLMDVSIARNAFGSQRESFETDLEVAGFDSPYRAVFIRAPAVIRCGAEAKPLARIDNYVVAVRQGNLLGLAFHPELTQDLRFHRLFMDMA